MEALLAQERLEEVVKIQGSTSEVVLFERPPVRSSSDDTE